MKLNNYIYIFIFHIPFFFYSCTEKISIDLDSSTVQLSIYGEITTQEKIHEIRLATTANYFSNQPVQGISGADVRLFDGTREFLLQENDTIPGLYETSSNFSGTPGKTYKLSVENVDINKDGEMESYSAISTMPEVVPIDFIELSYLSSAFISGWQVHLFATDPAGVKNFYVFKVYKNNVLLTDSLQEYIFQSDEFFDGGYTNGIISQFLSDRKYNEKANQGDEITFELNGITEEYYKFLTEAQSEISPKTPLFSGPSANVRSNINNNAVGFFTTYSVSTAASTIPE